MSKRKKVNPRRIPATAADIKRAKAEALQEAIALSWSVFMTVLRDKEGFDRDGLIRVWEEVGELSDSLSKGYCTVADLKNVLRQEEGAVLGD